MSSLHAPLPGTGAPFVMHLERVCRLIDMGAQFGAIEFNPNSDLGDVRNTLVKEIGLAIRDGGSVSLIASNGMPVSALGLRLGNYKRVWRIWQNGIPSEAQRRAVRWG